MSQRASTSSRPPGSEGSLELERLSDSIGYRFKNAELLRQALTHRSHSQAHNERLEFLGDSVVGCAIALALYRQFPDLPEGDLHRLRASLVSEPSLAAVAGKLDLGDYLRVGGAPGNRDVSTRPSVVADALEAIFGAAFLDGGFDAAVSVVHALFGGALETIDPSTTAKDPKTLLQEYLQSRQIPLPRYSIIGTRGEKHELAFHVACEIPQLDIRSEGEGTSRRGAEQNAARAAYERATKS